MTEQKKPITRREFSRSTRFFDLKPLQNFDGLKFPTNSDILRRYFYIKDKSWHSEKPRNIANEIYNEIEKIYSKVPCSMKKKSFCLDKICSLYKEWQYLSNNHKKCSKSRIEKFQKYLENTVRPRGTRSMCHQKNRVPQNRLS